MHEGQGQGQARSPKITFIDMPLTPMFWPPTPLPTYPQPPPPNLLPPPPPPTPQSWDSTTKRQNRRNPIVSSYTAEHSNIFTLNWPGKVKMWPGRVKLYIIRFVIAQRIVWFLSGSSGMLRGETARGGGNHPPPHVRSRMGKSLCGRGLDELESRGKIDSSFTGLSLSCLRFLLRSMV